MASFYCFKLFSQSLHGNIVDRSNKKNLQSVTVTLKKDTVIYKIEISDSLGNYSFKNLTPGNYNIDFSFINYQKASMSFLLKYDTTINCSLVPLPEQLKDVSISAKKPLIERKIDRLVFNVNDNVNVIGVDALELLSMTPEVKVIGNSVSIIGKGAVVIMINDKILHLSSPDELAAYLKSIPAKSIDRIEVITNPPAMYSAEGSSGLINIVLKKSKELGYNGSVNLNLTSPPSQTIAPGINLNYNNKNIRYYASLNGSDGFHNPRFSSSIFYPDKIQKSSTEEKEESQYIGGLIGFDADLSKTNTLGASFNIFNSYPYQTNTIRTLFINNQTKKVDSTSEQDNKNKIFYYERSANIHYVKSMDTIGKKKIVLDADWFSSGFDFPNKIESMMYNSDGILIPDESSRTISNNMLSSNVYSLNGVVYLPGKNYSFYFGGKINFIKSKNNVALNINNSDVNVQNINTSNSFSFTENTQALFTNYQTNFGKKWTFQSGLRGEYTQTNGISYSTIDSTHTNSYFKLFPTLYLSYNSNSKNTLSINYGRRIDRPSFNSFNPYLQYLSQYNYSEGNPYLRPSISNNFELSDSYTNLDVSLQYSFSNGQVGRIGVVDTSTNVTISQLYNFLSTRSFVISVNYTLDKIKWLQSMNEFDAYYNKTISSSGYTAPLTKGWGATFRSNNSFYFNKSKTIVGGLFFSYQFPEVNGINKMGKYYYFDVSGKYLLLNNKLVLAVSLSDVFKTLNIPFSNTVNGILTSNVVNNDSRRLRVSISYSFGNSKLKKGEEHSADSNNGRGIY